jgi:hypothetical protein
VARREIMNKIRDLMRKSTNGHKGKLAMSSSELFLSKAELDYLISNRQFDNDYSDPIKSRLVKKLHQLASQEFHY